MKRRHKLMIALTFGAVLLIGGSMVAHASSGASCETTSVFGLILNTLLPFLNIDSGLGSICVIA